MERIKGFKVFKPDWTCQGFQYQVGQTYEINGQPKICEYGFHFCKKASDCFNYYEFDPKNKVAEVEAIGEVDSNENKYCTNKIRIIREIPWNEVLQIVNEGIGNTGLCNIGDRNTGDRNTGNRNSGHRNSGHRNAGICNVGNCNTGNCNTGNCNTGFCNTGHNNIGHHNIGNCNIGNCNIGYYNTGDHNTGIGNTGDCNIGDWNTGDWNKSSFNNGCFNTVEPKIMMFNRPSEWTYRDWTSSDAINLLNQIRKNDVVWIQSEDMTDEEKNMHPSYKTTGGYMKILNESECAQRWWEGLTTDQKAIILALPNFDSDIFEEITGIRV